MSSDPKNSPRPVRPSLTQVIASALAAVSAAVISSTFGVAGTLIGAGVASIIASVGSTLYLVSIRHTNERLRQLASAARRADWSVTTPNRLRASAGSSGVQVRTAERGQTEEPAAEESTAEAAKTGWSRLRWSELRLGLPTLRRRWRLVAGFAVLVFVIAIGAITAFEAGTNEPVSALVGGSHGSGTSLGHVLNSKPAHPSPKPSPAPSSHVTPGAVPSSPSVGTVPIPQPTSTPSPTPALPTPSPSAVVTPPPSLPAIPSPATAP